MIDKQLVSDEVKTFIRESKEVLSTVCDLAVQYVFAVLLANAIFITESQLANGVFDTTAAYIGYTTIAAFIVYALLFLPRRTDTTLVRVLAVLLSKVVWEILELLFGDLIIAGINALWDPGTLNNLYANWTFVAIVPVALIVFALMHDFYVRQEGTRRHMVLNPKLDPHDARTQVDNAILQHHQSRQEHLVLGLPVRVTSRDEDTGFVLPEDTTRVGAARRLLR